MKALLKTIAILTAILALIMAWTQIDNRLWLKILITVILFFAWLGYELSIAPVMHEPDYGPYGNI